MSGSPVPPDVIFEHCAEWEDARIEKLGTGWGPYWATALFELPTASDKLFLLSGLAAAGTVKVINGGVGGVVQVEIIARYSYRDALEYVNVCAVNRGVGHNGVGIFVSGIQSTKRNSKILLALFRLRIGPLTSRLKLLSSSQRLATGRL